MQAELDALVLDAAEPAARIACPEGRDETANVEAASLGRRRARSPSRRSITSRSASSSGCSISRPAAKHLGRTLRRATRRRRAPASRAHPVHARPAHDASTATPRCTRRISSARHALDRAPASCRSSRPTCSASPSDEHELLPDPDRRGAGDQPRARHDPRAGDAAAEATSRTRRASAPRRARTARTRAA